ncbi:MAG TPA: SWIM zinc finger family protein [Puia sp.]|uniref:SWIM zinc finger family protein n=1 Tax=Puia sp. TaxID=2045100 RepID=UPI002CEA093D|nr:SWIM zinc finger family protein [Puia sp.]HVU95310.1 SWIM zinc finger family protein [Puia sp.]
MNLSEEQILALAPDDSSRKSGRDLATPAKWVTKGATDAALWGECQGSGSKPYQTQIDLNNLAFKCSCPSRKFPCKHGLGLLLLRARQPQEFAATQPPTWVTEWLSKRSEKEEKKAEKKDKPVDEAAQVRRQQARQQKVADGLDELNIFIKDIVRHGLHSLPGKGPGFWENMAKRMIDAQAPGLASQLKSIADINFFQEGWQTQCLDRILKLYLIIQGYKHLASLAPALQQDIRSLIGFPQNQDELKAQEGVRDEWFVLARQTSEEDKLIVERNWFYGLKTHRYALILQFYVKNQPPAASYTPGLVVDATLVFFPSAVTLRALVKDQYNTWKAKTHPEGLSDWTAVIERETAANARYPFAEDWPCIVTRLTPLSINNEWWLQDDRQQLMRLRARESATWNLLALSGGAPMRMSLIGKEKEYTPLGVWTDNEYKIL